MGRSLKMTPDAVARRAAKEAHDYILAYRHMLTNPREAEVTAESIRKSVWARALGIGDRSVP